MNLLENFGICIEEVESSRVVLSMEVRDIHKQPYGIMHGGVNALLAETAASLGANCSLDATHVANGVNITTQHLHAVQNGKLIVTATPLHQGKTLQRWDVVIYNEDVLVSSSQVTLIARPVCAR